MSRHRNVRAYSYGDDYDDNYDDWEDYTPPGSPSTAQYMYRREDPNVAEGGFALNAPASPPTRSPLGPGGGGALSPALQQVEAVLGGSFGVPRMAAALEQCGGDPERAIAMLLEGGGGEPDSRGGEAGGGGEGSGAFGAVVGGFGGNGEVGGVFGGGGAGGGAGGGGRGAPPGFLLGGDGVGGGSNGGGVGVASSRLAQELAAAMAGQDNLAAQQGGEGGGNDRALPPPGTSVLRSVTAPPVMNKSKRQEEIRAAATAPRSRDELSRVAQKQIRTPTAPANVVRSSSDGKESTPGGSTRARGGKLGRTFSSMHGGGAKSAIKSAMSASTRAAKAAAMVDEKPLLNMVVVGHVDAGKSTLMGHLLVDLQIVNQRTMHKFEKESKEAGKVGRWDGV